jgi:DNA-binding MarR family transcriptional regulator
LIGLLRYIKLKNGNFQTNDMKPVEARRGPEPGEAFTQEFVDEALRDSTRWIVWYLRRLVQAGDLYSRELNKNYRVSQPQLSCLLALQEYGPLSLSKLAKYILVKPSTVTGIIDRLEQKGLVRRERSLLDRRVVTINLTEAGEALAYEAPPPIPKSIVKGLEKVPTSEIKDIVKSLSTLVAMLENDSY